MAAGLFAAAFVLSGAWFDTGRVDSLFVALTLLASWPGVGGPSVPAAALASALLASGLLHQADGAGGARPRRSACSRASPGGESGCRRWPLLGGLVLGSTLALDATSEGWYRYYVFGELAGQPWVTRVWVRVLDPRHPCAPVAGRLAIAGGRSGGAPGSRRRCGAAYYAAAAAAGLIAAPGFRVCTPAATPTC